MGQDSAVSFIKNIKEQGFEIPKLQVSSLAGLNFVSAYDHAPTTIMANEVTAGVDYNADLAVTKALVEYFERKVFAEGVINNDPVCERKHSDGIAAFPVSNPKAKFLARENAYYEALERFAWAKWWDDSSLGFSINSLDETPSGQNPKIKILLEKFSEIIPFDSIKVVEPFLNDKSARVSILFVSIKGYGYISGGAAGPTTKCGEIIIRGLAELIRHGIALSRFIETKRSPVTFYEERLLYFGLGHGNHLVGKRLSQNSNQILELPELEIDDEIISENFGKLVAVHRCLFQGQPPFVDGELERLCL